MPALLLTEAEVTFEFTVADFDFPALPGTEDERGRRQPPGGALDFGSFGKKE